MRLTATEIAVATGGVLHGPDVVIDGASIDSRTIGRDQAPNVWLYMSTSCVENTAPASLSVTSD